MEKLRNCPFCGGEAAIVHRARRKVYKSRKYVYGNCVYCGVCDAKIFSPINRAVEMWNRRVGESNES